MRILFLAQSFIGTQSPSVLHSTYIIIIFILIVDSCQKYFVIYYKNFKMKRIWLVQLQSLIFQRRYILRYNKKW